MLTKLLYPIDKILNIITMYRLILYYLTALGACGLLFSYLKLLPFTPLEFIISTAIITIVCWVTNKILAVFFNSITNFESVYITAAILCLIITPSLKTSNLMFIIIASIIAMSSKYILAIDKKHLFNPAAIGILIPSLLVLGSGSWWVGSKVMLLPVILGGVLLTRKIQRFDLVLSFLFSATAVVSLFAAVNGFNELSTLQRTYLDTPILFFAFIMLTEPLTTPAQRKLRIIYGAFVGLIFSPQIHVGPIFSTPEMALSVGNLISYFISPKRKLMLTLEKKIKLAPTVYDFVFKYDKKLNYKAGQYLEWTLDVGLFQDSRGNRRYFTLASSPTEDNLRIGVKFYDNSSKFKTKLLSLNTGDKVLAGELSGDFTMPAKVNQNLVFMAGGIGITPFRSIIRYLLDKNIKYPITIFYSNKDAEDIVYKDILDEALSRLNIKTVYNLTDMENIPSNWNGYRGRINADIIRKEIKTLDNTKFYLSGPHAMVSGFEEILQEIGVSANNIKKDFFPGFV